jgi:hypothetical protein
LFNREYGYAILGYFTSNTQFLQDLQNFLAFSYEVSEHESTNNQLMDLDKQILFYYLPLLSHPHSPLFETSVLKGSIFYDVDRVIGCANFAVDVEWNVERLLPSTDLGVTGNLGSPHSFQELCKSLGLPALRALTS